MSLAAALLLPFALLQAEAAAPPQRPAADPEAQRFAHCVEEIEADAERAYETAMIWANEGRAANAYRCAAMALVAQNRGEDAGQRFEALALETADPLVRAELLAQAGNAYVSARIGARAITVFTQAIGLIDNNDEGMPDLLIDRSLAHTLQDDWRNAEEDLSRALDLRGNDPVAYRLRATARMQQRAFDLAEADANNAVRLAPQDVEARLVLGNIREAKRTGEIPLN